MGAAFLGHTQHLSPSHCAFMAHWLRLLDLEDAASRRRRAEVWALPGQEREAAGGCIARLALAEVGAGGCLEPACAHCIADGVGIRGAVLLWWG